jgi:hypothetical protein
MSGVNADIAEITQAHEKDKPRIPGSYAFRPQNLTVFIAFTEALAHAASRTQ